MGSLNHSALLLIRNFWLPYRRKYLVGSIFLILLVSASIATPILIRESINNVLSEGVDITKIAVFAWGIILFAIFKGVLMFLVRYQIVIASREIERDMKRGFFYTVLRMKYAEGIRWKTGDLMTRFTEDISSIRSLYGPFFMYAVHVAFIVGITVAAMFVSCLPMAVVAVTPLPLIFGGVFLASKKIVDRAYTMEEALSRLSSFTQQLIEGIVVVRSMNAERAFYERAMLLQKEFASREKALVMYESVVENTGFLALMLSIVMILGAGAYFIREGQATPGNVAEFIMYVNMMIWPLMSAGWLMSMYQKGMASARRVSEFLSHRGEKSEIRLSGKEIERPVVVEIKNVSFSYGKKKVLHDINAVFYPGRINVVVGGDRSGKSTLALLIARILLPDEGKILMNGISHLEIAEKDFRKMVGLVPQELFLFSDTIYMNVRYGAIDGAPPKSVVNAMHFSHIYDEILSMPGREMSVLGERGVSLSGGQRQRLVISRAVVEERAVLLLDEPFYFLNPDREKAIIENIIALRDRGTNIICFTAREKSPLVQIADSVWVLTPFCSTSGMTLTPLAR